jgi:hypothetical protein
MQVFYHAAYVIDYSCPMNNKINRIPSPLHKVFEERRDKVYNSLDTSKKIVINAQYES